MEKPVISYVINQKLPLIPVFNYSIIRKKLSSSSYVNWNNKKEFTDYVDTLFVPQMSDCYVYVKCQCGTEYQYADKTQVPSTNTTCTCGRKIIEYGN